MRYLLVLAKLDADKKRIFGAIATAAKLDLAVSEKAEAALTWLDGHEPRVVVFDTAVVQAEKLCHKIRSKKKLASVPLIALVTDTTDAFVERLYGFGADDVIRAEDAAALLARLRTLPKVEMITSSRGIAVIADKEHARCDVFGRVLMNAGYDVKFALDDVALKYYTQQSKPALVVASTEMAEPRPLIEEARKRGCESVWVITSPRRDLVRNVESLDGVEGVMVVASSTAPDNILFMSNELMRKGEAPARAAERVLYGTVVAFRAAGTDADDMGFSYNISAGGLYVRTLASPEGDSVWLELRPPRGKQRVRLQGRVAWRRFYDPASPAAVPPGFGVELTDGLGEGLPQWRASVEKFIQSTRMGRKAVAKLLADMLRESQVDVHELEDDVAAIRLVRDSLAEMPAESGGVTAPTISEGGGKVTPPALPVPPPKPDPSPLRTASEVPAELAAAVLVEAPKPKEPAAGTAALAEGVAEEATAADVAAAADVVAPLGVVGPADAGVAAAPALPDAAAPALPRSRTKLLLGSVVAVGVVAVGVAFALGLIPLGREAPAPKPPPSAGTAAQVSTPPPSAPAVGSVEPVAADSAADLAVDAPVSTEAGAAEPADGEAGTADAGSAALPPVEPGEGGDGSELPWNQGYIVVRSSRQADVFATGFKVGPTNQKNKSKCGLKFVRLGEGDPPKWLTKGQTVDVKCQTTTTLELEPD